MDSDLPLVSCIMLTRGRPQLAPKAVDCFLSQTYPRAELVILDDCESLSFADGLRRAWPANVSYQVMPHRLTIGAKRNVAVSRSQGDVIAHWDDDDWSAPERLSDEVSRLIASELPATGYNKMLFTDGASWWRYHGVEGYVVGTSLLYQREVWSRNRFPDQQVDEDGYFVARLACRLTWNDAGELMVARIHPGNTSKKNTHLNNKQWESVAPPSSVIQRMAA